MSLPFPPPPPPPPPSKPPSNPNFPSNSTSLPDFLLTTLSLFALFASPKHHLPLPPKSLSTTNRRFLLRPTTTTTMSLNPNPNPNFASSHPFPTPQSLSDWLRPRLHPDSLAAWGTKPGTKNIHNLWLELADGETSLIDTSPPVRNLEVLSLRILGPGDRILLESHQELSDGSVRTRNRPLSEKLKSGEDLESAVYRAVMEELGSILSRGKGVDFNKIVTILPDSYEKKVEQRDSFSYPGLPGCYVMHSFDVLVDGLPDEEFETEEGNEYGGVMNQSIAGKEAVSVKRHFWKWVSRYSL